MEFKPKVSYRDCLGVLAFLLHSLHFVSPLNFSAFVSFTILPENNHHNNLVFRIFLS